MQVEISDETYNEIKKWLDNHIYYKHKFTIEEIINTMVNLGWWAYKRDGFDGSVHPKKDGDFGIHC